VGGAADGLTQAAALRRRRPYAGGGLTQAAAGLCPAPAIFSRKNWV